MKGAAAWAASLGSVDAAPELLPPLLLLLLLEAAAAAAAVAAHGDESRMWSWQQLAARGKGWPTGRRRMRAAAEGLLSSPRPLWVPPADCLEVGALAVRHERLTKRRGAPR